MHQHRASLPVSMPACRISIVQSYFYHRALAVLCQLDSPPRGTRQLRFKSCWVVRPLFNFRDASARKLSLVPLSSFCQPSSVFILHYTSPLKFRMSSEVRGGPLIKSCLHLTSAAAPPAWWFKLFGSSIELWPRVPFAKLFRCTEGASSRPMPPQIFTRLRGPPSFIIKVVSMYTSCS